MTQTPAAPEPNAQTHLLEHCHCTDGMVRRGAHLEICRDCYGSQRRLRGTHDPRSAIDFDPNEKPTPIEKALDVGEKLARAKVLARILRDPSNSAPLTELLDLLEAL
jgi:hypothetical protein